VWGGGSQQQQQPGAPPPPLRSPRVSHCLLSRVSANGPENRCSTSAAAAPVSGSPAALSHTHFRSFLFARRHFLTGMIGQAFIFSLARAHTRTHTQCVMLSSPVCCGFFFFSRIRRCDKQTQAATCRRLHVDAPPPAGGVTRGCIRNDWRRVYLSCHLFYKTRPRGRYERSVYCSKSSSPNNHTNEPHPQSHVRRGLPTSGQPTPEPAGSPSTGPVLHVTGRYCRKQAPKVPSNQQLEGGGSASPHALSPGSAGSDGTPLWPKRGWFRLS